MLVILKDLRVLGTGGREGVSAERHAQGSAGGPATWTAGVSSLHSGSCVPPAPTVAPMTFLFRLMKYAVYSCNAHCVSQPQGSKEGDVRPALQGPLTHTHLKLNTGEGTQGSSRHMFFSLADPESKPRKKSHQVVLLYSPVKPPLPCKQ